MESRTLQIALSPDQERFIEDWIASGRYLTPSEMIDEGLRLLKEREIIRQAAIVELKQEIQFGIDEADRGDLIDGEEVFLEIERLGAERRRQSI